MDLKLVSKLLDAMPGSRSAYEFTNMVIEQDSSFHRQLKSMLLDKELKSSLYQEKQAAIALMKYKTSTIDDPVERAMAESINVAREIRLRREVTDLEKDLTQIDSWLSNHAIDDLEITANNFESGESEHWASQLGRQAAIELLSGDKTSDSTISKLTMLPLSDFKRAVQVTAQFAAFIKSTTEKAEQQLLGTATKTADTPAVGTASLETEVTSSKSDAKRSRKITASDVGIDALETLFPKS